MAEIYLGKAVGEALFQKIVAIKRILPHYAQDKEFIEMFRDEAHICKRLHHNNIVQVYDFTEVDGSYALVMEHVDGADLRSLLSACETAKTRLSVPMSLFIAGCAARALHYAHTKTDEITNEALGIVHRDISPQNILISYEGDVKITDFGIASAENKMTETRPGVVKGKYSYMSPEQVGAKPLDGRSDVFSLAIVLWETLAMKRLFAGMSEVESIRKVQNCEIPYDLSELNPEIDQELKMLVMKGLSKDRKQRYQTAAAFEKDLLRYLHTHYAEFTSRELGNFLKRILAKKRDRTQDDIKETLAQAIEPAKPVVVSETPLQKAAGSSVSSEIPKGIQMEEALSAPALRTVGLRGGSISMNDMSMSRNATGFKKNLPSQPLEGSFADTGMGVGNTSKHRRPMGPPPRKASRSRLPLLLFALGMLLGAAFFFRDMLIPDKKLHLELRSSPESVSLKINGVRPEDGGYKRTPIKLSLAPGTYELELSRPGYQKEVIRFQGHSGEILRPEKVFLKKLPFSPLVPVRVLAASDKVLVDIDAGLFEGETPLSVELLPGNHTATFKVPNEAAQYKCEFKIDRPSSNAPSSNSTLLITAPAPGQKSRCQVKNQ